MTPPESAYPEIKREIAEKQAARKPDTKGSWFAENFIWPAKGPISGVFGSQRIENDVPKSPHYGVDIAAPEGAPIVAPAGGIVTLAQPHMYFEGGLVFIDHGHGLISYMMHMSKVEVHKGEVVKQGEEIGRVGQTGRATGPHVHWGMYLAARACRPGIAGAANAAVEPRGLKMSGRLIGIARKQEIGAEPETMQRAHISIESGVDGDFRGRVEKERKVTVIAREDLGGGVQGSWSRTALDHTPREFVR